MTKSNTDRLRLRRMYLDGLIRDNNARCSICRCHVVRMRRVLRNGTFVKQHGNLVLYRSKNGKYCTWAGIATVGHIVDIEFGGTDEPSNIQLECLDCNLRKEHEKTKARNKGK